MTASLRSSCYLRNRHFVNNLTPPLGGVFLSPESGSYKQHQ
ncbi:gluconate 5-dehydrogenase [Yersinia sp. KBS0713]|nr:gluconate 5-dehydrogenase [Yersinia sp. KBS0713]